MHGLAIRPYEDADEERVLDLLAVSLGKGIDDRYRGVFRWKHLENPFGRSFMWLAEIDGRIVGFRAFLHWRFTGPGGEPVEAARAVDTATHPDFQGMGIFKVLTLHGLEEMRTAGIAFVFNTPNERSRPGYLKMGWKTVGRVPMQIRPRSVSSLWRMARSRTPAEPWSLPVDIGRRIGAADCLITADRSSGPQRALATDRTTAFLKWRYGGCPAVASVAVMVGEGTMLLRFRLRASAVQCTVGDVVGHTDPRSAGSELRTAMRRSCADYAIASAGTLVGGMLKAPQLGPILTRCDLRGNETSLPLALTLGDVELF